MANPRSEMPRIVCRPGTASHAYLTNDAGQVFRLRRDAIAGVQMGGQRTVLVSLFSGQLALILVPAGLLQWMDNSNNHDATDGVHGQALDIVDEVEVDARGARVRRQRVVVRAIAVS